ncbi:MAG: hypothetical protein ACRC2T_15240 [Thermoguttaceae bacterium]
MNTYYLQPCPTCGRSLQVRIAFMGRKVMCRHCHAFFTATDPDLELDDFDCDDISYDEGTEVYSGSSEQCELTNSY